jgi:MAF protein
MEILARAGYRFEVASSGVQETGAGCRVTALELAVALATDKARAVAAHRPDAVVMGADTVVEHCGRLLGKPSDAQKATAMLSALRGAEHTVITGVAVVSGGTIRTGSRSTLVKMREYDDSELQRYVTSGSPLDKAGGYGIQDQAFMPAKSISGCYLNVVGLPLCLAEELLQEAGAGSLATSAPCMPHDVIPVPSV